MVINIIKTIQQEKEKEIKNQGLLQLNEENKALAAKKKKNF